MELPQEVEGILADVRRQLSFRTDIAINKLRLYDEEGELLVELTEFFSIDPPKKRFGDAHETTRIIVVEDATDLSAHMAAVKSFRYVMIDEAEVETESAPHFPKQIPKISLGRNKKWKIDTTTETFVTEFFTPPGA